MRNVNFTGNKIMGPLHIFGTDKETLQIWYVGASWRDNRQDEIPLRGPGHVTFVKNLGLPPIN